MAALHAAPALRAPTDRDAKRPDERPLDGQFFVILHRDPDAVHGPLAPRTPRGERGVVGLVDVRRRTTMAPWPIRGAGRASGPPRGRDPRAAREGRSLTIDRPPRGLELVFQFLVLASQALPLGFRAPEIRFELPDPARLIVDDLLRVSRRRLVALRHAAVMPDSRSMYK
jgi:hypothetical protein